MGCPLTPLSYMIASGHGTKHHLRADAASDSPVPAQASQGALTAGRSESQPVLPFSPRPPCRRGGKAVPYTPLGQDPKQGRLNEGTSVKAILISMGVRITLQEFDGQIYLRNIGSHSILP